MKINVKRADSMYKMKCLKTLPFHPSSMDFYKHNVSHGGEPNTLYVWIVSAYVCVHIARALVVFDRIVIYVFPSLVSNINVI